MKARKRIFNPTVDKETSRVKQEFRKEVDINTIVSRMKAGQNPPAWMTSKTPRYGDFTQNPQTLMEAFDVVAKAEEAFLSLPVEFRRELDHNPMNLDRAPRSLFERYNLVRKEDVQEAALAAPGASSTQRVQGDRDLPATGRLGPNKRAIKPQQPDSEESEEA